MTQGSVEVSTTKDFLEVVNTQKLNEDGFVTIDLELEKTYYWRIIVAEKEYFKGVIFTPLKGKAMKFNWEGFASDEDNFRIREYDENQKRILSISTSTNEIILENDYQNLKYLVPMSGNKDILKPNELPQTTTTVIDNSITGVKKTQAQPNTIKKVEKEDPPKPLPKLIRDSNIYFGAKLFSESFTVKRSLSYESPETKGGGSIAGGQFFHKFYVLSVDFDSHGTNTTYDSGDDAPRSLQKRFFLNLRFGVDILNIMTRYENHALVLSPGYNFGKYPVSEDDESFNSSSIYLEYIYLKDDLPIKVRFAKSNNLQLISIEKHWNINRGLNFAAGLFQRSQNMEISSASSEFSETALTLGLSHVIHQPREDE